MDIEKPYWFWDYYVHSIKFPQAKPLTGLIDKKTNFHNIIIQQICYLRDPVYKLNVYRYFPGFVYLGIWGFINMVIQYRRS